MSVEEIELEEKLNIEVRILAKEGKWNKHFPSWDVYVITFDDFISNKILLVYSIRKGLPYSFFDTVRHISPFGNRYWSDLFGVSQKTVHSYERSIKFFEPRLSEKIIEVAEVTKLGMEVFGNRDKFKLWMETPSRALGNLSPSELLKDSYGKDLVIGELTRINYGILA